MKKQFTISAFVLLSLLTITACSKLKELADVKFNADYETTIDVGVTSSGEKASTGVFFETVTIDPLSDSDMNTYADKLKEIDVVEATAEIVSLSTPIQLISASLTASGDDLPQAQWIFSNLALEVGTLLTLDNTNGQFNNLEKILKSKKAFTVTLLGQTDVNEASFALKIKFKTRVTANPLN